MAGQADDHAGPEPDDHRELPERQHGADGVRLPERGERHGPEQPRHRAAAAGHPDDQLQRRHVVVVLRRGALFEPPLHVRELRLPLHRPDPGNADAGPLAVERAVQLADVLRRLLSRGARTTPTGTSRGPTSSPPRSSAPTTWSPGFDDFAGSRNANNYQSGSNYRMFTTSSIFQGGDIFPVVGLELVRLLHADRGAEPGQRRPDALGLLQRLVATERPALVQPRREVRQERRQGQLRRRHGGRQRVEPPPRRGVGRPGERQGEGRRELRQVRRGHPGEA